MPDSSPLVRDAALSPSLPSVFEARFLHSSSVIFDRQSSTIIYRGRSVELSARASSLLEALMANCGHLLSKREIFQRVWKGEAISDAVLTTAIKEIRRALCEDARSPDLIKTVHSQGYMFLEPVSRSRKDPRDRGASGISEGGPAAAQTAYLMISFESGYRCPQIVPQLELIPSVIFIHSVTGAIDLIVRIDAEDMKAIEAVRTKVAAMPGVAQVSTSLVLDHHME